MSTGNISSKTWWGRNFIEAVEAFTDSGRLSRGRAYRSDNRIKQWHLKGGKVTARIRGNANPYFGVHQEPTYSTRVQMTTITQRQWRSVIEAVGDSAASICKLIMNEMPDDIEQPFKALGLQLLPVSYRDFNVDCSCPDGETPCKHIAGVCYRLSEQLDQDPFLLFELRGLSREQLHQELARLPLGKALLHSLQTADHTPPLQDSYFTRPETAALPDEIDVRGFWTGAVPLPNAVDPVPEASIPALLIKKGGDFPPFWHRQTSFIEVMEEYYLRLRKNSQKLF